MSTGLLESLMHVVQILLERSVAACLAFKGGMYAFTGTVACFLLMNEISDGINKMLRCVCGGAK